VGVFLVPSLTKKATFMTNLDWGRKEDLEELSNAIKEAKTNGERQHYEKIMFRILGESDDIRYWREQLLRAIRVGDDRRKQYVIRELQVIRLNETAGKSWGNSKGNRSVS